MLVQMAKLCGAKPVVAVVGASHKVETCEALGADVVVDKSRGGDWWAEVRAAAPEGFAAVFDANGVATLSDSYEALARTGALVIYGFHTNLPTAAASLNPLSWLRMVLLPASNVAAPRRTIPVAAAASLRLVRGRSGLRPRQRRDFPADDPARGRGRNSPRGRSSSHPRRRPTNDPIRARGGVATARRPSGKGAFRDARV